MSNLPDIAQAFATYVSGVCDGGGESSRGASQHSDRGAFEVMTHRYDKLHADVRSNAMMTKTCYMEYDPMNVSVLSFIFIVVLFFIVPLPIVVFIVQSRGVLPRIYARCIGPVIGNTVILQDTNLNQIQVVVERDKLGIYFTHGWSRLRDFYKISAGAWVVLTFVNPFLFHIKLINITGVPITCPLTNPLYKLMLEEGFQTGTWDAPTPFFVMPKVYSHRLEKTLTVADVTSGNLTLLWGGFCKDALPDEQSQLTLIDWIGNTWKECHLRFDDGTKTTCKISGQWSDICKIHHLADGVVVKFGVTEASNNKVIYFKLSPFIGVRTTLHAPSKSGDRKFIHQTQHYFML
ncbi:unnamed protein product [Trifolium pratense]|uniref:Uncharacterized protein n=1 Tax=Trifolium pratense TaxID=57577 RepID=A0ACB0JNN6_TRIPR|nr:unnamed protein product [Trifolium pratense]